MFLFGASCILLPQVELKTTPFETYNLMRGQASGSMFGNTLKVSLHVYFKFMC